VQTELKRIGCYTNGIDGDWGPNSQRAFEDFSKHSGTPVASAPTAVHLATLQAATAPVCPLVCDAGERVAGNRCVARVKAKPAPVKAKSRHEAERVSRPPPAHKAPNCGAFIACLSLYRSGIGDMYCNRPKGC
jgi:hypothetical protein